jgi:hypothetical protein
MDRRAFLTSAAGTFALTRWPALAPAQASAVESVPIGLLSATFSALDQALLAPGAWNPYPKPGDARWSTVPQPVREALIARADEVNSSPWP